jgi:hypothetical protein
MFTNRADVISLPPKFTTPQNLLDLRNLPEYLSGCYALDGLHHLLGAISWNRLYQKVHMVLIHTNLQKLYLVTLRYLHAYVSNYSLHPFIKNNPPVFGRTYNVIDQYRNMVSLVYKLAHAP